MHAIWKGRTGNRLDIARKVIGEAIEGLYRRRRLTQTLMQALEPRVLMAADLQISEFLADNVNSIVDEDLEHSDWIELYNKGDAEANLDGLYLTDDRDLLSKWALPAITLDAGARLVVFASGKNRTAAGGKLHTNYQLNANGEYVALVQSDGASIISEHDFGNQEADISRGYDGSVVRNFATPTPGAANQRSQVIINEIHYDPDVKTQLVEFIELHNPGTAAVDLSGASFTQGLTLNTPDGKVPAGTILAPGGYLVVAQNPAQYSSKFVGSLAPAAAYIGSLSNEGEALTLVNASGGQLDSVDYNAGFPWPLVGQAPGRSIQLANVNFDNDLGGNWRSALPSPGRINTTVQTENLPPQMRQVDHTPNTPVANVPVTITATITDPQGVKNASVQYQLVDPGAYINLTDAAFATNWTSVPMYDDGTHGDATPGDNVWTAVLPPELQTHRRLVRYRVTATDNTDLSIRGPYLDDTVPNFAYLVYNGVPGWSGAIRPGDPTLGTVTQFTSDDMSRLPIYQIISKKNDVETAMIRQGDTGGSEERWLSTFVYNGVVYDHVGYRARGGVWRYAMGKNKWHFDFPHGHPFQAKDDYGNDYNVPWDNLILSGIIQQGDFLHRGEQGLFEAISFKLFELAGVPANKNHYIQLRVIDEASEQGANQYGGDLWGMYLALEQSNGDFLEEHGLPDGNLYRMQNSTAPTTGGGTLSNQGPTQPSNNSDLKTFTDLYKDGTPDTDDWWRQNLDLDSYYSYRSIVESIHHYDIDESNDGKNYFYFHNPETNKWQVLPWDVDLTWANNMFGGGNSPFRDRVLNRPALRVEYLNRLREVRDLLYNSEQTGQLIDEVANIIDPIGVANSPVDYDRMMWDYNPIMTSQWVNPSKSGVGRFYQQAADKTFRGMAQIMKSYITSRQTHLNSLSADPAVPVKPTVTPLVANFPVDDLRFRSSNFSDTTGTFAAMKWRIAEVAKGTATAPGKYEINALWEQEFTEFTPEVTIPGSVVEAGKTYRVRVKMKDSTGRWSNWSNAAEFVPGAGSAVLKDSLRITEINYNPAPPAAGSEFNNQDFEFIEFENIGAQSINLAGVKLTNGINFTFGNVTLDPGAYGVLVRNRAAFESRYGTNYALLGEYGAGATPPNLNDNGERVTLVDAAGQTILDFSYKDSWVPHSDGGGYTIVSANPANAAGYGDRLNWRSSDTIHGLPGLADPGVNLDAVVINEALSHSVTTTTGDWIELRNTTGQPIDIGGWFLSDDSSEPKKFRLAPGTTIPANGYLVLTETEHFNNAANPGALVPFALDASGDSILLANDVGDDIGGYREFVDFAGSDPEVTFGLHTKSTGGADFTALVSATPGAANAAPIIGPIVFNEVMYNPAGGPSEFVEIRNLSNGDISLAGWKLHDAVDFVFPTGAVIPAGSFAIVVSSSPDIFRSERGIPAEIPVFGPFTGTLDNDSDDLKISKPGVPDAISGEVPFVIVDKVKYEDESPWPTRPDGDGPSMIRFGSAVGYSNDPATWTGGPLGGSPGLANIQELPVVNLHEYSIINQGGSLAAGGAFADPDAAQSWTATVNWGDGTPTASLPLNADKSFSLSRAYSAPGTFVVTVTVSDNLGGSDSDQLVVSVLPATRNGTALADTYTLRLDPTGRYTEFYEPGTPFGGKPSFFVERGHLQAFTFNGGVGNDTLIIDMSNGNPVPAPGMTFIGGAGAADRVRIIGSPGNDQLVLESGKIFFGADPFTSPPLTLTTAEEANLALGDGDDSLVVNGANTLLLSLAGGAGVNGLTVNGTVNADSITANAAAIVMGGLTLNYTDMDAIALNGGAGNDTFTLGGDLSSFDYSVNGESGDDILRVNSTATIAGQSLLEPLELQINTSNPANPTSLTLLDSAIFNAVSINGLSRLLLASGRHALKMSSLSIPAGGLLDVNDGGLILANATAELLDAIRTLVLSGRGTPPGGAASGQWNGTSGITSSAAQAAALLGSESRILAYGLNSQLPFAYSFFLGQSVEANDLLLRFTKNADATLDGKVDNNDVTVLQGFYDPRRDPLLANLHPTHGDYNYNGRVDDLDVSVIGGFYDPNAQAVLAETQARPASVFSSRAIVMAEESEESVLV